MKRKRIIIAVSTTWYGVSMPPGTTLMGPEGFLYVVRKRISATQVEASEWNWWDGVCLWCRLAVRYVLNGCKR